LGFQLLPKCTDLHCLSDVGERSHLPVQTENMPFHAITISAHHFATETCYLKNETFFKWELEHWMVEQNVLYFSLNRWKKVVWHRYLCERPFLSADAIACVKMAHRHPIQLPPT
jgi:hypothetical protein